MRLFIAAEMSDPIKEDLQKLVYRLQVPIQRLAQMRWVGQTQFHVTLKFLGDCEDTKVSALLEVLRSSVCHQPRFDIQFHDLGCFPPAGLPQVLWLGISQGEAEIRSLAEAVKGACKAAGFPEETRPFNAHLTLGRIKESGRSGELRSYLKTLAMDPIGPCAIHSISLMQSHLTAAGPTYQSLETIRLLS